MCPCCGNAFHFTRTQCTWCRRLVCHKCVIGVPANRFDDPPRDKHPHNACRACFEERMTGQDQAESAFDELSKPDEMGDAGRLMAELGRAVSGQLDQIAATCLEYKTVKP